MSPQGFPPVAVARNGTGSCRFAARARWLRGLNLNQRSRACGIMSPQGFPPVAVAQSGTGPCRFAARARWLRGLDLNQRPLGYEPNELPDCSTPHLYHIESVVIWQWSFRGGAGVICNGDPLEPPVIPAKAGIQSDDTTLPKFCGVDSRFRGNDRRFRGNDCAPNETAAFAGTTLRVRGSFACANILVFGILRNLQWSMLWESKRTLPLRTLRLTARRHISIIYWRGLRAASS